MASYSLNEAAVANLRRLINARQHVLDSDWGTRNRRPRPTAPFLDADSLDE